MSRWPTPTPNLTHRTFLPLPTPVASWWHFQSTDSRQLTSFLDSWAGWAPSIVTP